jgi:hypothetical protein
MIHQAKQVLSPGQIDQIMAMYRDSTNNVMLNGEYQDRHYASTIGHFQISEFTTDEVSRFWPDVKNNIPVNTELVYARVLKYNRSCFIPKHVDSFASEYQQENDISVIIQLNDPNDYVGGLLLIGGKLQNMAPGDMVLYTYEEEHEVKTVRRGTRYVLNLRCKSVK